MSRDYSHAALPATIHLLGLKLRPLSLGHVLTMKRHDVAFVSEVECAAGIEDLLLGVLICSMTWEEWQTFEDSSGFSNEIARWGRTVRRDLIRNHAKDFNLLAVFETFKRYVNDSCKVPEMWFTNDSGSTSDTPWFQSVKLTLMGELNHSLSEAMNCPLQAAILDYCRNAESHGIIKLISDEEMAAAKANSEPAKAEVTA